MGIIWWVSGISVYLHLKQPSWMRWGRLILIKVKLASYFCRTMSSVSHRKSRQKEKNLILTSDIRLRSITQERVEWTKTFWHWTDGIQRNVSKLFNSIFWPSEWGEIWAGELILIWKISENKSFVHLFTWWTMRHSGDAIASNGKRQSYCGKLMKIDADISEIGDHPCFYSAFYA